MVSRAHYCVSLFTCLSPLTRLTATAGQRAATWKWHHRDCTWEQILNKYFLVKTIKFLGWTQKQGGHRANILNLGPFSNTFLWNEGGLY